jgi:anti-sigma B factor antagonist
MNINTRSRDGIVTIEIIGVLDTNTSPEAESVIGNLLEQGHNRLIINLKDTDYLSSSGLRVLLATAKKLWAIQGKLKICRPNQIVKEILDTSGFSMILDVRESEEQALSEF